MNTRLLWGFLSIVLGAASSTARAEVFVEQHFEVDLGSETQLREYTLETPKAERGPDDGWPVVLLFHGVGHSRSTWDHCRDTALFPGLPQNITVCGQKLFKERLLDAGFAVLTIDALLPERQWTLTHHGIYDGPARNTSIENRREQEQALNPDLRFVKLLIDRFDSANPDGDLQPGVRLDRGKVHVAGFSAGGLFAMFAAQYLGTDYIKGGATASAGYLPGLFGSEGLYWRNAEGETDVADDHPPMIVVNTIGFDWVTSFVGIWYKNDLIAEGIEACHYTHLGGLHAWHSIFDRKIIEFFQAEDKSFPHDAFCLPKDFCPVDDAGCRAKP